MIYNMDFPLKYSKHMFILSPQQFFQLKKKDQPPEIQTERDNTELVQNKIINEDKKKTGLGKLW